MSDEARLATALARGSVGYRRLPRIEDDLSTRLAARLARSHASTGAATTVRPATLAHIVDLPKPGGRRPVALLTLADRAAYWAAVERLRPAIERALPRDRVLPGGPEAVRRLEEEPLSDGARYLVRADVTQCFQSVDHAVLGDLLTDAGAPSDAVAEGITLLGGLAGESRGLPQGPEASYLLADAYLLPVDRALISAGARHVRRRDDIRVAAPDAATADRVLATIADALAQIGMVLNADKTDIVDLFDVGRPVDRRRPPGSRVAALRAGRSVAWLGRRAPGARRLVADLAWRTRPRDLERLTHAVGTAAASAVDESRATDGEAVDRTVRSLAARCHPEGIGHLGGLLLRYPGSTLTISGWVEAVARGVHKSAAADSVEAALSQGLAFPWQEATLYRSLRRAGWAPAGVLGDRVRSRVGEAAAPWVVRAEAARLLGWWGEADRTALEVWWEQAPAQFRPDLLAVALTAAPVGWGSTFASDRRDELTYEVVLARRRQLATR